MTDTTDPTILASLLSDRDDTIASLRALLKAKEHEIADLTRDRDRFEGRILARSASTSEAADALLGAEAQRFLVVDPYSADGDDMRDAPVAAGVGVAA